MIPTVIRDQSMKVKVVSKCPFAKGRVLLIVALVF